MLGAMGMVRAMLQVVVLKRDSRALHLLSVMLIRYLLTGHFAYRASWLLGIL